MDALRRVRALRKPSPPSRKHEPGSAVEMGRLGLSLISRAGRGGMGRGEGCREKIDGGGEDDDQTKTMAGMGACFGKSG